jgi:hypothetical protein
MVELVDSVLRAWGPPRSVSAAMGFLVQYRYLKSIPLKSHYRRLGTECTSKTVRGVAGADNWFLRSSIKVQSDWCHKSHLPTL